MSSLIGKKVNFLSLKNIVLIGGGDLMAVSAKIFKELNFNVTMIVATRHIDEKLALSNNTLADYCKELSINPHVITDINLLTKKQLSAIIPKHSLALCFGPAWVFNNQVLSEFFYGMFNINAIPIPHYLGGAHYTWQLLNKNIDGGCFFQQITDKVDQGDIFDQLRFNISPDANTPNQYFAENVRHGTYFIQRLATKFIEGNEFIPVPYSELNKHRLYFPRLRTDRQAYINWHWTAQEIVSFCQGFDEPYSGAASFIKGIKLRFKKVRLITLTDEYNNEIPPMHPFCSGLIIRISNSEVNSSIIVAARDGFIALEEVSCEEKCYKSYLKEGMRIHTPQSTIDDAMSYEVTIDGLGFKD